MIPRVCAHHLAMLPPTHSKISMHRGKALNHGPGPQPQVDHLPNVSVPIVSRKPESLALSHPEFYWVGLWYLHVFYLKYESQKLSTTLIMYSETLRSGYVHIVSLINKSLNNSQACRRSTPFCISPHTSSSLWDAFAWSCGICQTQVCLFGQSFPYR